MFIANEGGWGNRAEIICAESGDSVERCLIQGLANVARPSKAFAYVDFNSVIITLTKESTLETALVSYRAAMVAANNAFMDSLSTAAK